MGLGRLFVISAPSGTGKTTIVHRLVTTTPGIVHSISYTTRVPRRGEWTGCDYHFVSPETFQQMITQGDFVEWATVHGASYGTPRAPLEAWRLQGLNVVLDLDVQGARTLQRAYPDAISIFVMPPSREVLIERLKGRGTEDAAAFARRIQDADREMAAKDTYHYVVINDALETVCEEIRAIIAGRRSPSPS